MSLILEQFDQLIHSYEKAIIENARLSCQVCKLTTENARLRERMAGLIDPVDDLAEDVAKHCAVECPG